MNLANIVDRVVARENKARANAVHLLMHDAAKQAEKLSARPRISRRALLAIHALHAFCEELGAGTKPTEDELLELWAILKKEVVFAKL